MEDFSNRLKKALMIKNMKPIDLANRSGINKATISQYLSGKYRAKQDNIYILSKALDINEAWLMGYDVPIDRIPDSQRSQMLMFTANDSSMAPLLDVGDIAYIEPQETFESGNTILFKLDDKELIRKVVEENNTYEFLALNPYYPAIKIDKNKLKEQKFTLIGKVIKVELKSAFK